MDSIRENRKRAQRKLQEAEAILSRAQQAGRDLTDDEVGEYEGLIASAESLRQLADRAERLDGYVAEGQRNGERRAVGAEDAETGDERRSAYVADDPNYSRAFRNWLRNGNEIPVEERSILQARTANLPVELRALSVSGDGTTGGYTVPESFYGRIVEVMKDFSGVRQAGATVLTTTDGTAMPIPTNDDTGNAGYIVDENDPVNEVGTTFGQKRLGSFMYSSGVVKVSFQLLQDNGVNLEQYLANILGKRVGRITNAHFTTGAGTTEPEGIMTAITLEHVAAAPDAITLDDVLGLIHTVDPAYRGRGCCFMTNDSTVFELRKLKDKDDRPLWQPSVQAGQPSTLMGYPLITNNAMAEIAADESVLTFGDHSAYFIRDVIGGQVLRLRETYAANLQHGFLFFSRHDGVLTDTSAVAKLTMADS